MLFSANIFVMSSYPFLSRDGVKCQAVGFCSFLALSLTRSPVWCKTPSLMKLISLRPLVPLVLCLQHVASRLDCAALRLCCYITLRFVLLPVSQHKSRVFLIIHPDHSSGRETTACKTEHLPEGETWISTSCPTLLAAGLQENEILSSF